MKAVGKEIVAKTWGNWNTPSMLPELPTIVVIKQEKPIQEYKKEFLTFSALTFLIVAALVAYNPIAGLFLFVLPMIIGLLLTSWGDL